MEWFFAINRENGCIQRSDILEIGQKEQPHSPTQSQVIEQKCR
jgi:hypothetical protein